MPKLPHLSIETGKRVKRDVFTFIFKNELEHDLGMNLTYDDTLVFEKAYSRTLKQILTYGSFMDNDSGIYYKRSIGKNYVMKAHKSDNETLMIGKPTIRVNKYFVDKDIIVKNGKSLENGDFQLENGEVINPDEYQRELMLSNFNQGNVIRTADIVVYNKELMDYLKDNFNETLHDEDVAKITENTFPDEEPHTLSEINKLKNKIEKQEEEINKLKQELKDSKKSRRVVIKHNEDYDSLDKVNLKNKSNVSSNKGDKDEPTEEKEEKIKVKKVKVKDSKPTEEKEEKVKVRDESDKPTEEKEEKVKVKKVKVKDSKPTIKRNKKKEFQDGEDDLDSYDNIEDFLKNS